MKKSELKLLILEAIQENKQAEVEQMMVALDKNPTFAAELEQMVGEDNLQERKSQLKLRAALALMLVSLGISAMNVIKARHPADLGITPEKIQSVQQVPSDNTSTGQSEVKPQNENIMKKSELKALIHEVISEMYKEDFAPLGVAEEKQQLTEKAPPDFPKKLHDKLLKQYEDDPSKAYATMWKIFYAKKGGNKRVDEMWMAFEGKEMDKKHDETDMSNPEEKREVELAKKAKEAADAILKMHGK